ncbi:CLUMA_CG019198, isoform A [Clunio marinus]|uniref:CLUMA_CG019198, isoform A n=1 Tax=Clunio marinus TaxID=568069 RepID=A0A1J1J2Y0_9DIPT|nr:CLUMA_CG019198, isoform A [Clunio marinus]
MQNSWFIEEVLTIHNFASSLRFIAFFSVVLLIGKIIMKITNQFWGIFKLLSHRPIKKEKKKTQTQAVLIQSSETQHISFDRSILKRLRKASKQLVKQFPKKTHKLVESMLRKAKCLPSEYHRTFFNLLPHTIAELN